MLQYSINYSNSASFTLGACAKVTVVILSVTELASTYLDYTLKFGLSVLISTYVLYGFR